MKTKRDKARNLIKDGKTKESLLIVKTFDKIYSKEELRVLQIAYECLTDKESFYKQIKVDTDKIKVDAVSLLQKMLI